jgi:hypothetical protein
MKLKNANPATMVKIRFFSGIGVLDMIYNSLIEDTSIPAFPRVV